MKRGIVALMVVFGFASPAQAAPGDPRLVQGVLEWPAKLTRLGRRGGAGARAHAPRQCSRQRASTGARGATTGLAQYGVLAGQGGAVGDAEGRSADTQGSREGRTGRHNAGGRSHASSTPGAGRDHDPGRRARPARAGRTVGIGVTASGGVDAGSREASS